MLHPLSSHDDDDDDDAVVWVHALGNTLAAAASVDIDDRCCWLLSCINHVTVCVYVCVCVCVCLEILTALLSSDDQ